MGPADFFCVLFCFRSIFTVRKYNLLGKLGGSKVDAPKRFLYVRRLFARYLPQTSINTCVCNNSFFMFLRRFSVAHRCVPCFSTLGGHKKVPWVPLRISLRFRVCMFSLINIEQIWFYILFLTAKCIGGLSNRFSKLCN